MKLKIEERVVLIGLLPKESDFLTVKKIKELIEKLNFTEKELKEFSIKTTPQGGLQWNKKGTENKTDISIGEVCEQEIVKVLKDKNEKRNLQLNEVSLYEKFIEKIFDGSGKKSDQEIMKK